MSFSSDQKEYIINQNYKSSCCRRALLQGALLSGAYVDGNTVILSVERPDYATAMSKLVREFYGRDADIVRPPKGGRRILTKFESKSASNFIVDSVNEAGFIIEKCPMCTPSFLRGIFLAVGRISDPEKQYSLEFSLGERSEMFSTYFSSLSLNPKISAKKNETVVYFKNSTDIEEFLGHANMNPAMFSVIEARFNGEARKNIMRTLNCETKNLQKAVNAAVEQTEIITALAEANLLSSLPEELEAAARLRMRYPDYSLSQLAAAATPTISKSGLSHRFKKLIELGKQLLHK